MKKIWNLPLIALCLGSSFVAAGLTLLIVQLFERSPDYLLQLIYLLIALGGGLLIFLGFNAHYGNPGTNRKSFFAKQLKQPLPSKVLATVILILAGFIFTYFYGIAKDVSKAPKSNATANLSYESAKVLRVSSEVYRGNQDMEYRPEGNQYLELELTTGKHAGKKFSNIRNYLTVYNGTVLQEGDNVIVAITDDGETVEVTGGDTYEYDRTIPLIFVLVLFLLATVLVGGKVGAKSLLGLGLTILCVFTVLFPLLIGGWPTLPTILGMCAFVTIVEFTIIGGANKKIFCAILGTISGVAIAMLFGELSAQLLRLTGYQMIDSAGEIEALGNLRRDQGFDTAIRLNDLLVGGILVAALGAVNDVAMSISSAMNELVCVNPNLTRKELFKSGMNIGRDMVGTMTNTLILALVGGSFVEILYYSSLDLTFYELMSTTYLPIELMQAVASSIGVILAVPLSVLFGMIFFSAKRHS